MAAVIPPLVSSPYMSLKFISHLLNLAWVCDLLWPKECGASDSVPVLCLGLTGSWTLPLLLEPAYMHEMNKPQLTFGKEEHIEELR